MGERLIGAHMPTSGGLHQAVTGGKQIGCTAVQVFTSSPRQWKSSMPTDEAVALFRQSVADTGIEALVSHDSYLINMAAPDEAVLSRSIDAFRDEMLRCHAFGIPYVVTHMGSHLKDGEAVGLRRLGEAVNQILEETPDDTFVTLETTAGQGTNLGYHFEHLAFILAAAKGNPRVVVCLDTCHVFAAGYNLADDAGYEQTMKEFGEAIGFDRLKVVHCNDSVKECGARVDRHAHIGEGQIGLEAFRCIVNDPRLAHAPLILETPEVSRFEEQVALLRSLIHV